MTLKEAPTVDAPPDHPYVTQVPGVCGGRPVIRGTRTPVSTVVGYYKMGETVDEILVALPHLTPAQVLDALGYYHDHQDKMDAWFREHSSRENLLKAYNLRTDEYGNVIPIDDES